MEKREKRERIRIFLELNVFLWKIEIRKDVILNKELGNLVIKGILL